MFRGLGFGRLGFETCLFRLEASIEPWPRHAARSCGASCGSVRFALSEPGNLGEDDFVRVWGLGFGVCGLGFRV